MKKTIDKKMKYWTKEKITELKFEESDELLTTKLVEGLENVSNVPVICSTGFQDFLIERIVEVTTSAGEHYCVIDLI